MRPEPVERRRDLRLDPYERKRGLDHLRSHSASDGIRHAGEKEPNGGVKSRSSEASLAAANDDGLDLGDHEVTVGLFMAA